MQCCSLLWERRNWENEVQENDEKFWMCLKIWRWPTQFLKYILVFRENVHIEMFAIFFYVNIGMHNNLDKNKLIKQKFLMRKSNFSTLFGHLTGDRGAGATQNTWTTCLNAPVVGSWNRLDFLLLVVNWSSAQNMNKLKIKNHFKRNLTKMCHKSIRKRISFDFLIVHDIDF